ncbi:MAG: hypothetical protein ACI90V_011479, partial [Bacillariaceae sp.]
VQQLIRKTKNKPKKKKYVERFWIRSCNNRYSTHTSHRLVSSSSSSSSSSLLVSKYYNNR